MVENLLKELVDLAKKDKEYTQDTLINLTCICFSDQMREKGYTPEDAMKKAINLIKTGKSKSEVYIEMLKLAGYEE